MAHEWWRYIALSAIVLILSMIGAMSMMEVWTQGVEKATDVHQRQMELFWLKLDDLQKQVEQLGRADLSRGIELSQTKSRVEKLEISVRDAYKAKATRPGWWEAEPDGR